MDTWAVVVATAVGPIAAVLISMWVEERRSARQRQHWVFSTLMGLRGVILSADHVRAINVVQVEFHKSPKVIAAWKAFLAHLETDGHAEEWALKHRDLLNALLSQIAESLGIKADSLDIARGGYYPTGWAQRSNDQDAVLRAQAKIAKLVNGQGFDNWLARMADADHRAAFEVAVKQLNSQPSPIDRSGPTTLG